MNGQFMATEDVLVFVYIVFGLLCTSTRFDEAAVVDEDGVIGTSMGLVGATLQYLTSVDEQKEITSMLQ
jgi:succinate-acetate transporter protein